MVVVIIWKFLLYAKGFFLVQEPGTKYTTVPCFIILCFVVEIEANKIRITRVFTELFTIRIILQSLNNWPFQFYKKKTGRKWLLLMYSSTHYVHRI